MTLASARDGRTVDKEVASVWADDLRNVSITDAVEAATLHYQESTAWMMPNHVIANVKRIRERHEREDRIQRQLNPPPAPAGDPNGIEIYRAEVARLNAERAAQTQ